MNKTIIKFDDVQPCKDKITNFTNLNASIKQISKLELEASGCNTTSNIIPVYKNAFIAAVHEAYDKHYGLVLSPDDIWIAITQGFVMHVNANVEKLRHMFVSHEGKNISKSKEMDL